MEFDVMRLSAGQAYWRPFAFLQIGKDILKEHDIRFQCPKCKHAYDE